jgi:hypothetical protein
MATPTVALLATAGDDKQVLLQDEGKSLLSSFNGPVVFVSICGPPGSGKSTLCDFLTGRADVSSNKDPKEQRAGVWLHPTTLMDEDSGAQVALLDLQALYGPHYDALFQFCVGISGLVLYNSPGLPTEEALLQLGNCAREIPTTLKGGDGELTLPKLVWVSRNTSGKQLDAEFEALKKEQAEAGGKEKKTPKDGYGRMLFERALKPAQGFDEAATNANEAKQILTSLFKSRDCVAMPKPSANAGVLENVQAAEASALLDNWHLAVNKMVQYVSRQNLNIMDESTFVGKALSGQLMSNFLEKFVGSQSTVAASTIWPDILKAHLHGAESQAFDTFQQALNERVDQSNIDYMKTYLEAAPDEDDAEGPDDDTQEDKNGIDANAGEGQTQKLSSWLLKKMHKIGAKPDEKKTAQGDAGTKKSRFRFKRKKRAPKEDSGSSSAAVAAKSANEETQSQADKLHLPIDEVDLWGIYRECKQLALAHFTEMCSGLGKDIEIDNQTLAIKRAVAGKLEAERKGLFEVNSQASQSYCQAILYRLHLSMTASCQLYRLSRATGRPVKLIADKQRIDKSGTTSSGAPLIDSSALQGFFSLGFSDFHSKLQVLVGVYRQTARGPAQATVLKDYLVSAVDGGEDDSGASPEISKGETIMRGCVPRQLEDWGDALSVEHSKVLLDVLTQTNEARIELNRCKEQLNNLHKAKDESTADFEARLKEQTDEASRQTDALKSALADVEKVFVLFRRPSENTRADVDRFSICSVPFDYPCTVLLIAAVQICFHSVCASCQTLCTVLRIHPIYFIFIPLVHLFACQELAEARKDLADSEESSIANLGDVQETNHNHKRSSSVSEYNIQHSGYLLKQGGGTTMLSRKNWKQRFFVLSPTGDLIYSASEDDYHRQLYIKQIQLSGCVVMDTPRSLDITIKPPPAGGMQTAASEKRMSHVVDMRPSPATKFIGKSPDDLSSAESVSNLDSGRVFHLRAINSDSKREWIAQLKKACGNGGSSGKRISAAAAYPAIKE